jgi:hypothetical protein
MFVAMAALIVSLVTGSAPADITGKWDGTINATASDGTPRQDTALLILTQKDKAITGTVGGNENDQHPIVNGSIEGNKVTILAKHQKGDREYKLELTLEGDEMKGKLSSGERTADLALKKRKQ